MFLVLVSYFRLWLIVSQPVSELEECVDRGYSPASHRQDAKKYNMATPKKSSYWLKCWTVAKKKCS